MRPWDPAHSSISQVTAGAPGVSKIAEGLLMHFSSPQTENPEGEISGHASSGASEGPG